MTYESGTTNAITKTVEAAARKVLRIINNVMSTREQSKASLNVTLDNVTIDASETGKAAVRVEGKVTIELDGKNTLTGGELHAGLEKENSNKATGTHRLTITDDDNNGKLITTGGTGGAGIGGSSSYLGGYEDGLTDDIIISGGDITAKGGEGAAGIGAGDGSKPEGGDSVYGGCANAYEIVITGKDTKVNATGGTDGAGIGGGRGRDSVRTAQGDYITIQEGAYVIAKGGKNAAGIGGGNGSGTQNISGCSMGAEITITGKGTYVEAEGGWCGAGIGGGRNGQGGSIYIEDGADVTATGGAAGGAGIGSGVSTTPNDPRRAAVIKISGGTVKATGGIGGGAGIGGGKGDAASTKGGGNGVSISGGNVTATGGNGAAGIGSGKGSTWKLGSFVDITGGHVTAIAGSGDASGIGSGEGDAKAATVTIDASANPLDVTAITYGKGEAITGENSFTMASLGNANSGIVKSLRSGKLYQAVHNGLYVGSASNDDVHLITDGHRWGSGTILRQATPETKGLMRYRCTVDGCNGYYEAEFDYVERPDTPDKPTTPDVPETPETPSVPGGPENITDENGEGTDTPAAPAAVTAEADAVAAPAIAETAAAPARNAPAAVQAAQRLAGALPQTGADWLSVLGTALGGLALLALGLVPGRKQRRD